MAAYSAAGGKTGTVRISGYNGGQDYNGWAEDSGKLAAATATVNRQLTAGNQQAALGYLKSVWGGLSGREQAELQGVLAKYGIQYKA